MRGLRDLSRDWQEVECQVERYRVHAERARGELDAMGEEERERAEREGWRLRLTFDAACQYLGEGRVGRTTLEALLALPDGDGVEALVWLGHGAGDARLLVESLTACLRARGVASSELMELKRAGCGE